MLRKKLTVSLERALKKFFGKEHPFPKVKCVWEVPQNTVYGDFSTNIAMLLAKKFKKSPLILAKSLIDILKEDPFLSQYCERFDAVTPGFINLYFSSQVYWDEIPKILHEKENYGRGGVESHKKI